LDCHLPPFSGPGWHLVAFVPARDEGRMLSHIWDDWIFSTEAEPLTVQEHGVNVAIYRASKELLPFSSSHRVHQVAPESAKFR
jgi:hypothetical protein